MQNAGSNPGVNVRAFKRSMTRLGTLLALAEVAVLAALAKLFPVPEHITTTPATISLAFVIVFLAVSLFFIPLWIVSDRLHRKFGLTAFLAMMFVYKPLDEMGETTAEMYFAFLTFFSALACLCWAWVVRRESRKLAWACGAMGGFYILLFILVPLVGSFFPAKTRAVTRSSASGPDLRRYRWLANKPVAGKAGIALLLAVGHRCSGLPEAGTIAR